MNKKNLTLPELVINEEEDYLSKLAKNAQNARERVNEYTTEENEQKKQIAIESTKIRSDKAENDEIIGKITISPPNQGAVRVEFRINNGSLDVDEMDNLNKLFEGARSELFEKVKIVDKIINPDDLITALVNAGLNPWDYLNISVKPAQDQIIIDKGEDHITTAEAILPRKGLLALLPNLIKKFSEEAKIYIREYLKQALKPTVVLGTKVKK